MLNHKIIKSFVSVAILFIIFYDAKAQNKMEIERYRICDTVLTEKEKLSIQKIKLTENFLVKEITNLINKETLQDTIFKKRGYIEVFIGNLPYQDEQVLRSYRIKKQFSNMDNMDNDLIFPLYYTYIEKKIVLIHLQILKESFCYQLSDKSKKSFQKKLEPFLVKPVRVKLTNSEGKKTVGKNFRPQETYQLHGGKTIYIIEDEPPVIVEE